MLTLFVRTLFTIMFVVVAWERICDSLFLWLPGIKLAKTYVLSFSEKYVIFIATLFTLSGISASFLAKHTFSRAIILVSLSYGFFELMLKDPFWLIILYTFFVGLAFLIHNAIEENRLKAFCEPLHVFFSKGGWRFIPLPVIAILISLSSLYNTGIPTRLRTVHPAPPDSFLLKEELIKLKTLENPYRTLETKNRAEFEKLVREGGIIYYQNCFFCHGDKLDGKGHFADTFNPKPADFTDPGTIAQLKESYLFWRIATGGPGLPKHSAPWDSVMPVWGNYLSKNEIWKVILFLYDASGQRPKTF